MALYNIGGDVAPGYEAVYEAYEANFIKDREASSQLCVYVGGVKVVDIWGSRSNPSYNGDSLQNVFSSTKSLAAIAIAWCVDRGLLSYTDPIVKHWPQLRFKDTLRVCDVLRHESGLQKLSKSVSLEDIQRSSIKNNSIGKIIEMELQNFPPSTRRCYHTVTRGWILNELFRRVHPHGLTIGEFFHKEFEYSQLQADVHIGFSSDSDPSLSRTADLELMGFGSFVLQTCLPSSFKSKKVDLNLMDLVSSISSYRKRAKNSGGEEKPQEILMEDVGKFSVSDRCLAFNKKEIRLGEIPSANGTCSARGLAKIASAMSMKGSFGDNVLISKETWEKMHSEPIRELDSLLGSHTVFTLGGVNEFRAEKLEIPKMEAASKNREGFYGWMGLGGSVFQWHPDKQIGFAYTPTFLEWYDMINIKGSVLQRAVVECVDKLKSSKE